MSTLTKKIKLGDLGGAMMSVAEREAEEALTRSIVGVNKSKEEITSTLKSLGKGILAKAVGSYINSEIVDTVVDVYSGIQFVKAGYHAYKGANKFAEAYKECTDAEAEEMMKALGIK